VSSEASERDVRAAEEELDQVAREVMPNCQREVRRADSKVHAILEASKEAHMVLLRADTRKGLSRFFFGSLANEIAARAECTVLMLHPKDTG
jgi:nucleotide-binding universal stress UspA family protein